MRLRFLSVGVLAGGFALAFLGCPAGTPEAPVDRLPIDPQAWKDFEFATADCGALVEPADPGPLVRWPYLNSVTSHAAVVLWGLDPDLDGNGTLEIGRDSTYDRVLVPQTEAVITFEDETEPALRLVTAPVDGLEPGREYCYRIRHGDEVFASGYRLRTAPATNDAPVRFIVLGDFGTGTDPQYAVIEQMAAWMATQPVDLFVTTGDNVYMDGTHREFQEFGFWPNRRLWAGPAALVPSWGNHDIITELGKPYKTNFVLPRNILDPAEAEQYYSLRWGPLEIFVLDSEIAQWTTSRSRDNDQLNWLEQALATSDAPWKWAVMHQPPYTGNPARNGNPVMRRDYVPLFEQYGVQVVFAGHEHIYERYESLVQMEPRPVHQGGVAYITTGGGGRRLYKVEPATNQAVGIAQFHYVRGAIEGCRMWVEAVDLEGGLLDAVQYDICGP